MKRFALIGKTLGHSYSQQWFSDLFARLGLTDHSYRLHEMMSLEGLRQLVDNEHIDGFNVTIPYKQAIIALLDDISPEANAIGAVNCVCVKDGRLTGHNTDAPAFKSCVRNNDFGVILGTGGAARAVSYALQQLGIGHCHVSRTPELHANAIGYAEAKSLALNTKHLALINATPVGMYPHVDESPWPWPELLCRFGHVYDLIYNPSPTLLMRQAAAQGCTVSDGTDMLHRQAELSWQLWQRL